MEHSDDISRHNLPPQIISPSTLIDSDETVTFWTQICDVIRPRIGPEFDRWFGGLTATTHDSGEVVI